VVLAVHSDIALAMRGADITAAESEALKAVPYSNNDVYLHTGAVHVPAIPPAPLPLVQPAC
jgi:predicted NAD/FAD-binding protein